jgi:hypothetical protein
MGLGQSRWSASRRHPSELVIGTGEIAQQGGLEVGVGAEQVEHGYDRHSAELREVHDLAQLGLAAGVSGDGTEITELLLENEARMREQWRF